MNKNFCRNRSLKDLLLATGCSDSSRAFLERNRAVEAELSFEVSRSYLLDTCLGHALEALCVRLMNLWNLKVVFLELVD